MRFATSTAEKTARSSFLQFCKKGGVGICRIISDVRDAEALSSLNHEGVLLGSFLMKRLMFNACLCHFISAGAGNGRLFVIATRLVWPRRVTTQSSACNCWSPSINISICLRLEVFSLRKDTASLPSMIKAVVPDRTVRYTDSPGTKLNDANGIIVQVYFCAQNPTDVKCVASGRTMPGMVSDFMGKVVAIGNKVKNVKLWDRVTHPSDCDPTVGFLDIIRVLPRGWNWGIC